MSYPGKRWKRDHGQHDQSRGPGHHGHHQQRSFTSHGHSSNTNKPVVKVDLIRRPGFGTVTDETRIKLLVNFFRLKVPNLTVHEYDVEIIAGSMKINHGGHKKFTPYAGNTKKMMSVHFREVLDQIRKLNNQPGQIFYHPTSPHGTQYVYDGNKNFYTLYPLIGLVKDGDKDQITEHRQDVTLESTHGTTFKVIIKFATSVDLNTINEFISGVDMDPPREAFKAVDIIMRHGPTVSRVALGHGLFNNVPENRHHINNESSVVFGHYQAMKTTAIGPALNIDRISAVFHEDGPFLRLLAKSFFAKNPQYDIIVTDDMDKDKVVDSLENYYNVPPRTAMKELIDKFTGLKVSTSHAGYRKTFKIKTINERTPNEIEFLYKGPNDNRDRYITVAEFFKLVHGIDLRFPRLLPCVEIGSGKRRAYIPIEILTIEPNQNNAKMKKNEVVKLIQFCSSQTTESRFQVIAEAANYVQGSPESIKTLQEFQLEMDSEPIRVDGFMLPHPRLGYGHEPSSTLNGGRWTMTNKKVFKAGFEMDRWLLINLVRYVTDNDLSMFTTQLEIVAQEMGLSEFGQPKEILNLASKYQAGETLPDLRNVLKHQSKKFSNVKPDIIVFVFEKKNDRMYQEIKFYCDCKFGVMTQCISDKCITTKDKLVHQNILLKINTKFDGINCIISPEDKVDILKSKAMVIAADVTHPDSADRISTSIAAVVASCDNDQFVYYPSIRVQYGYSEIISDIGAMITELGHEFFKRNQYLPEKVIFYRDGVSDNMFPEVMDKEVSEIKRALESLVHELLPRHSSIPKLTFIVVQKRHHTRFKKEEQVSKDGHGVAKDGHGDKKDGHGHSKDGHGDTKDGHGHGGTKDGHGHGHSKDGHGHGDAKDGHGHSDTKDGNGHGDTTGGNIPSGTTIDTKVIHPTDFDFYLCSQDCIRGTPRPAHYYVLMDDNAIAVDMLYKMTFQLCHLYAPATRSVSIPAPVQYAHLAAKRSRHHLIASFAEKKVRVKVWQKMDPRELAMRAAEINDMITVTGNLKERMYFI